jgi:hypothetical protein
MDETLVADMSIIAQKVRLVKSKPLALINDYRRL